jgi:hypothetical protein
MMRQDAVQAEQDGIKKALAEWEALPGKIGKHLTCSRKDVFVNSI